MAGTAEQGFCATLDAAQEYMALQEALAAELRAGFLSLAQARYSMGAERVSALQYPTHMLATARVRVAGTGELELDLAEVGQEAAAASRSSSSGADGSTGSWTAAQRPEEPQASPSVTGSSVAGGPDASGGSGSTASSEPGGESVEAQLQRLRLAAQQSDSLVEQLGAKYGCGDGSGGGGGQAASSGLAGGAEDEEYEEVAKPGRPLHWFGSLVAPSLRDAEAHFARGLALAVQAANSQRRLRHRLGSCSEAAQAVAGTSAAAAEGAGAR